MTGLLDYLVLPVGRRPMPVVTGPAGHADLGASILHVLEGQFAAPSLWPQLWLVASRPQDS